MRVACFTNIAPHYRARLWLEMLNAKEIEFHFVCDTSSNSGIRQIDFDKEWTPFLDRIHKVRNVRIKRVLFFQIGVISNVLFGKWDAAVFLGDMNLLSNWIAAILMRMMRKKVLFWGHGLYGNETKLKLSIRKLFLSIAHGHFLYGQYAKHLMHMNGFDPIRLKVVYNSLDYYLHKSLREKVLDSGFYESRNYFRDSSLPVLIFIGRLTFSKKIGLLIESLRRLRSNGLFLNLLIIGDGVAKRELEDMSISVNGQVHFYGACYDEEEIGRLLANADLCVSPGNVGLTAIHSMSFGTPVCTHDDMRHQGPEAEAVIDGKTGIFYNTEELDLDRAIEKWFCKSMNRNLVRRACYEMIESRYNPYVQLDIFRRSLLEN